MLPFATRAYVQVTFSTSGVLGYPDLLPELTMQLLSAHTADMPSELVLKVEDDSALASTDKYLSSKLRYTTDEYGQEIVLLRDPDNEIEVGVMMGWERELSRSISALAMVGH